MILLLDNRKNKQLLGYAVIDDLAHFVLLPGGRPIGLESDQLAVAVPEDEAKGGGERNTDEVPLEQRNSERVEVVGYTS